MKDHYINATLTLLAEGAATDKILSDLKRVLEAKGHTRLYASILRGLLRQMDAKQHTGDVTIILAKEADLTKHKEAIESALERYTDGPDHTTTVDENIIGGFVLRFGNTVLDQSYKTRLVKLYRSLIT